MTSLQILGLWTKAKDYRRDYKLNAMTEVSTKTLGTSPLGWPGGEVEVTKKKVQMIFLPLMVHLLSRISLCLMKGLSSMILNRN